MAYDDGHDGLTVALEVVGRADARREVRPHHARVDALEVDRRHQLREERVLRHAAGVRGVVLAIQAEADVDRQAVTRERVLQVERLRVEVRLGVLVAPDVGGVGHAVGEARIDEAAAMVDAPSSARCASDSRT